jgi:hypothetical protein
MAILTSFPYTWSNCVSHRPSAVTLPLTWAQKHKYTATKPRPLDSSVQQHNHNHTAYNIILRYPFWLSKRFPHRNWLFLVSPRSSAQSVARILSFQVNTKLTATKEAIRQAIRQWILMATNHMTSMLVTLSTALLCCGHLARAAPSIH